jgi:hypothetical protein
MADPSNPFEGTLAANWITIWQSEWAAVAVDREVQEAWLRAAAQAGVAQAGAVPPLRTPGDAAPGSARPVPPARASAAADAPDPRDAARADIRDAAIADLLDRVAELERRAAASAADPADR